MLICLFWTPLHNGKGCIWAWNTDEDKVETYSMEAIQAKAKCRGEVRNVEIVNGKPHFHGAYLNTSEGVVLFDAKRTGDILVTALAVVVPDKIDFVIATYNYATDKFDCTELSTMLNLRSVTQGWYELSCLYGLKMSVWSILDNVCRMRIYTNGSKLWYDPLIYEINIDFDIEDNGELSNYKPHANRPYATITDYEAEDIVAKEVECYR